MDGKVLRGSHDGFVEAMVPNLALLRRRIRDPRLTTEGLKLAKRSRTDAALCYLEDRVDRKVLAQLREKLESIDMGTLNRAIEDLAKVIEPLAKLSSLFG